MIKERTKYKLWILAGSIMIPLYLATDTMKVTDWLLVGLWSLVILMSVLVLVLETIEKRLNRD